MARLRAADYDDKRLTLLAAAAKLFAEQGYDRTSISDIATACGVSKALLYHYYGQKEQMLVDIIRAHLLALIAAVTAAGEGASDPREKLRAMVAALLDAYRDADAEHRVQIAELPGLGAERQEELKALERELVAPFAAAIGDIHPGLKARGLLKPVTMSLFGMLNWHYMWFRQDGPMSREDYAALATALVVEGAGRV